VAASREAVLYVHAEQRREVRYPQLLPVRREGREHQQGPIHG
jgi:hypothetical protein